MRKRRREVSILLFAVAKGLEVCLKRFSGALAEENQAVLRPNEQKRVQNLYTRVNTTIDTLTELAQHLWDTSKAK